MRELTRRAIYGGTFDPVHRGHLVAAREVRAALGVEDFRFLPAGDPPHRDHTHASPVHRRRMLELCIDEVPGAIIDDRELTRDGPSWMSVTLDDFRSEYPGDALLLVLGQDALNGLDRWHDWRRIPDLAHLVVVTRPGEVPCYGPELDRTLAGRTVPTAAALAHAPAGGLWPVSVTPVDVSSTEIRRRVDDPVALRRLVTEPVADYIETEGLYRSADGGGGG